MWSTLARDKYYPHIAALKLSDEVNFHSPHFYPKLYPKSGREKKQTRSMKTICLPRSLNFKLKLRQFILYPLGKIDRGVNTPLKRVLECKINYIHGLRVRKSVAAQLSKRGRTLSVCAYRWQTTYLFRFASAQMPIQTFTVSSAANSQNTDLSIYYNLITQFIDISINVWVKFGYGFREGRGKFPI